MKATSPEIPRAARRRRPVAFAALFLGACTCTTPARVPHHGARRRRHTLREACKAVDGLRDARGGRLLHVPAEGLRDLDRRRRVADGPAGQERRSRRRSTTSRRARTRPRPGRSARTASAGETATAKFTCAPPPPPSPVPAGRRPPPPPAVVVLEDPIEKGDIQDIFFDYDKSEIRPEFAREARARPRAGSSSIPRRSSRSRATATSAGPASTTSPSATGAPTRRATTSSSSASTPAKLKTISYGKERPFVEGHDESAWSKNRRAHFVQTKK